MVGSGSTAERSRAQPGGQSSPATTPDSSIRRRMIDLGVAFRARPVLEIGGERAVTVSLCLIGGERPDSLCVYASKGSPNSLGRS